MAMKPNKEQALAINSSPKKDILISAGAGSGKTKTLSEKVFQMVSKGIIKPDELLVLTFTNNAAHEMKERIIKSFKSSSPLIAKQMLSAHIQTFDSFSQYLVSMNASRLGLADNIGIIDASVISSKRSELLDEIILEKYESDFDLMVECIKKTSLIDDKNFKNIILGLDDEINKIPPSRKKEILDFDKYEKEYFSKEKFALIYNKLIDSYKEKISNALKETYFLEKEFDKLYGEEKDFKSALRDQYVYSREIDDLDFDCKELTHPLYLGFVDLLKNDGEKFVEESKKFYSNYGKYIIDLKTYSKKRYTLGGIKKYKESYKRVKKLYSDYVDKLYSIGTIDEEFDKYIKDKEIVKFIINIISDLENRLMDYKRTNNRFTFADISNFALELVTEDKYSDIASSLRDRFSFIMVDEYQDTNDFQEIFINSLIQPNSKGERAHLFCVGDAKQAIYAFRNSNVALFRNRQKSYIPSNDEHEVIYMNTNYRSGPGVLEDINYFFKKYMTLNHGAIDYSDESEQLKYDWDVNLYKGNDKRFGIFRILPDANEGAIIPKDWEAKAIIKDIKDKIENKYQIFDREIRGFRDCRYSDFAILMRTKSSFDLYAKLFNESNIPLNNKISVHLKEIDAIIVIQSLLKLIYHEMTGYKVDVKHLFASIVRSYIYQYDDEKIYKLISYKDDKNDLKLIEEDLAYIQIKSFATEHKGEAFSLIFKDLLNEFGIIEKLYLIGNIEDNINKIESLNSIIESQEENGDGYREFLDLIESIDKYSLNLDVEQATIIENAVDMMTIHASKGLEKKVVYMPVSASKMSTGGGFKGTIKNFYFSLDTGINLPDYTFKPVKEGDAPYKFANDIRTLPILYEINKNGDISEEVDEHVRLLYVALTRAENAFIIVGEHKAKDENLYEMLNKAPHYEYLNEDYINKCISSGIIDKKLYDEYNSIVNLLKDSKLPLDSSACKGNYLIYLKFVDDTILRAIYHSLHELITNINVVLFNHYIEKLDAEKCDKTRIKFYCIYKYGVRDIDSYERLIEYIEEKNSELIDPSDIYGEVDDAEYDQGDDEEDEEIDETEYESTDRNEIETKVNSLADNLINRDYSALDIYTEGKNEEKLIGDLANRFTESLVLTFEDIDKYSYTSYKSEEYDDIHYYYPLDLGEKIDSKVPKVDLIKEERIDDSDIEFTPREKKRASKLRLEEEEGGPSEATLDYGTHLHMLMELMDFENPSFDYIKDEQDRKIIQNVLNLPMFKDMKGSNIYREYGYYDDLLGSCGYIDLMYEKGGNFVIIDYKSSNIDDEDYDSQLHVYQRNVMSLFKVGKDHIKLYLVSLRQNRYREVEVE